MNVSADRLLDLADSILRAWGMPPDDARVTAQLLVETDLRAIDSHGVSMLPMYEGLWQRGTLNMRPARRVLKDSAVIALIDADRGLGHPVAREAMAMACDKALAFGLAAVGVRNSHHFGATGLYPEMAAERGLLGLVTSSTSGAGVLPTHGAQPLMGTNPIAFAAPARRNAPFLLDMSTSTVAINKVKVYALNDRALPDGWFVDGAGQGVHDPGQAMDLFNRRQRGGVTPLGGGTETGGHKGYGLAAMVQILSSALTGGSFSPLRHREQGAEPPHNIGHFFLAIDPRAFRAEGAFEDDVDLLVDTLRASEPTRAGRPVQVAGDPERAARRERAASGIPLPDTLLAQLRAIAARAGVPFALAPGAPAA